MAILEACKHTSLIHLLYNQIYEVIFIFIMHPSYNCRIIIGTKKIELF